jgi:hypothetical protein
MVITAQINMHPIAEAQHRRCLGMKKKWVKIVMM